MGLQAHPTAGACVVLLRPSKITEYVFDKVDGADGQQIGIQSGQDQNGDAEKQREGDIDPDDDGAKQHPLKSGRRANSRK